jgi:hypothetical protein
MVACTEWEAKRKDKPVASRVVPLREQHGSKDVSMCKHTEGGVCVCVCTAVRGLLVRLLVHACIQKGARVCVCVCVCVWTCICTLIRP